MEIGDPIRTVKITPLENPIPSSPNTDEPDIEREIEVQPEREKVPA